MAIRFGWPARAGIFKNDPPKSPWGSGGNGGGDGNGGPRNPWSLPPEGRRPRGGGPGAGGGNPFDDWLNRARRGGGGSGGGGGIPGLPAGGGKLWAIAVVGLVVLWLIYTSFHVIAPQERGVTTFFGRYWGTLEPGVNWTLPAPLMRVDVVDVQNIRTESFPADGGGENLMLTGDQNIVDLNYSVRWDVVSAPDYVFQIAKPLETVRATAETAMRAVVATATLNDTIGAGRAKIEGQVQIEMQRILDDYHAGVRVQGVAIKAASAPQAVDEEFKKVTAAQQEAEGNKNNANAYAQQVLAAAQGDAAEFDKIYEQYKLAPEVTKRRLYYETMEAVLSRSNKTIVEAPGVTPYLALPTLKGQSGTPAEEPAVKAQPQAGAQ